VYSIDPLEQWVILLKSWTLTGYFWNSICSFVTSGQFSPFIVLFNPSNYSYLKRRRSCSSLSEIHLVLKENGTYNFFKHGQACFRICWYSWLACETWDSNVHMSKLVLMSFWEHLVQKLFCIGEVGGFRRQ
jgi:hypothetical protein